MIYVAVVLFVFVIIALTGAVIRNRRDIEDLVMTRNIGKDKHTEFEDARERIEQLELKPYADKIRACGDIDVVTSRIGAQAINGKPRASVFFENVYINGAAVPYGLKERRAVIKMDVDDFMRFVESLKG